MAEKEEKVVSFSQHGNPGFRPLRKEIFESITSYLCEAAALYGVPSNFTCVSQLRAFRASANFTWVVVLHGEEFLAS